MDINFNTIIFNENNLNKSNIYKISKYKENKKNKLHNNKELSTLDSKHRQMVLSLNENKKLLEYLSIQIDGLTAEINILKNDKIYDNKNLFNLLDKKEKLELIYNNININYNEMDYYDNVGDLINEYYDNRDNKEVVEKKTKSILDFLSDKSDKKDNIVKSTLYEKYFQRINGSRIYFDDGSNRIKYCIDCNIEKILDIGESSYICPYCGECEIIILDEDRQIKDYSPYKRLNHFREWLNQFQAKQNPDIPEQVFIDILKELNKNRIIDLSSLNKKNIKLILKKLNYNIYYEHVIYIINKLNNLPPPKITKDMEKIFISIFYKIQKPWEIYKSSKRKNFLSYSYVLYKFCELLELDHLLDLFSLHKDVKKIMENDQTWEKICKYLNWEFIPSFK